MAGGLFAQTPEKAAGTPVLLATAPAAPAPRGGFFAEGATAAIPEQARDGMLAARNCERTARTLGLAALAQTQR